VRLFTRNGYDWTDRYPLIVEAALRNRSANFVLDGEAVLLGVDGRSDFEGLHSRKQNDEVQFYAFDMLVSDGEDIRKLPLSMRKANLARLLARRVDGIFLSPFEQGETGPDLFRHACKLGSKAWCRSTKIAPIGPAARRIGSKSRTPPLRPCIGPRMRFHNRNVAAGGVLPSHHRSDPIGGNQVVDEETNSPI